MFPELQSEDGIHWFRVDFEDDQFEETHVIRNNDMDWLSRDESAYTIEIVHVPTHEFAVIDRRQYGWDCDKDIERELVEYVERRLRSLREHDTKLFRVDIADMLDW